jgi:hypothetical protein
MVTSISSASSPMASPATNRLDLPLMQLSARARRSQRQPSFADSLYSQRGRELPAVFPEVEAMGAKSLLAIDRHHPYPRSLIGEWWVRLGPA